MKKMVGSEKQVAWAEDIRSRYAKTLETLREALETYKNVEQEESVDHDPIFGDTIITTYTKQITPAQDAAIVSSQYWHPEVEGHAGSFRRTVWVLRRAEELKDEEHGDRMANAEFLVLTIEALEKALEEETDAKYWIDRR
jgi:hypothetical protein